MRRTLLPASFLVSALALGGCSIASTPAPTPTPTPACTGSQVKYAARATAAAAAPADPTLKKPWNEKTSDANNFDGCAALSWVYLRTGERTEQTPLQIAFFNEHSYVGTALPAAALKPWVKRVSAEEVRVSWSWPKPGENTADAKTWTGRSLSTYKWNAKTQKVDRTGTVPPAPSALVTPAPSSAATPTPSSSPS